jgi:hypothetical protein
LIRERAHEVLHEIITRRAYAFWQSEGSRRQGADIEDWLKAESEIKALLQRALAWRQEPRSELPSRA